MSGKTIFDNGKHKCIVYSDLVKGEGIQSNQFLILNTDNGETNFDMTSLSKSSSA